MGRRVRASGPALRPSLAHIQMALVLFVVVADVSGAKLKLPRLRLPRFLKGKAGGLPEAAPVAQATADKQSEWLSGPTIATALFGLAIVGMSVMGRSPKERRAQQSVLTSMGDARNSRKTACAPPAKGASMNGNKHDAKPRADDAWCSDGWYQRNADPLSAERPEWDASLVRTSCTVPDAWASDAWYRNVDPLQAERPQWDQSLVRTSCVQPAETGARQAAVETIDPVAIASSVLRVFTSERKFGSSPKFLAAGPAFEAARRHVSIRQPSRILASVADKRMAVRPRVEVRKGKPHHGKSLQKDFKSLKTPGALMPRPETQPAKAARRFTQKPHHLSGGPRFIAQRLYESTRSYS